MHRRVQIALAIAVVSLVVPASALAYTSRRATASEAAAIIKDAKRTQPCGYDGKGKLSAIRVVQYTAKGVVFKWAQTDWTLPQANGCVLVFLSARGHSFNSTQTPRHARVSWLAFTCGSSPFEDRAALTHHWRKLGFKASAPNWLALAKALNH